MLEPADWDLIKRDRDVPGLATLLHPPSTINRLRPMLGLSADCEGQLLYLRYKPRTNCLVAYGLEDGGRRLTVSLKAHRVSDWTARCASHLRRSSNEGATACRPVIADLATVVAPFPHDHLLRSLVRLGDAYSQRRLLHRILPNHPDLWHARIRRLAYKPERRFVAQLVADGKPSAVVKFYCARRYDASRVSSESFDSRPVLRIPQRLGKSNRHRALAFQWLDGELLQDAIGRAPAETVQIVQVGEALATLHGQRAQRLRPRTPDKVAKSLLSLAAYTALLLPRLDPLARHLASRLARYAELETTIQCPIHGDFSAKQLVLQPGCIGFLDFDAAATSDPAADLGSFLAHLEYKVLRGQLARGHVDAIRDALLASYCRASGNFRVLSRVDLYTAISLFLLAAEPFRSRVQNWPEQMEAIFHRVQETMSTEQTSHRPAVC